MGDNHTQTTRNGKTWKVVSPQSNRDKDVQNELLFTVQ